MSTVFPARSAAFQSTLPRGSDFTFFQISQFFITFQSTLPRGSDGQYNSFGKYKYNFNPRSLAGATVNYC